MEQLKLLGRRTNNLVTNAQQNVPAPVPAAASVVGRSLRNIGTQLSRSASAARTSSSAYYQAKIGPLSPNHGDGFPRGTWERVDDIPALRRSSHSLDIVAGCAYIFGGDGDDDSSSGDFVDNTMHVVRLPFSGASVDYFRIPAVSELDAEQQHQQAVFSDDDYDETSPRSSKGKGKGKERVVASVNRSNLGYVPAPRAGHASAVIGSRIFVFGGHGVGSETNKTPLDEAGRVWVFDTRTHAWSYLDPAPAIPGGAIALYPAARSHHCAAATDRPQNFSSASSSSVSAAFSASRPSSSSFTPPSADDVAITQHRRQGSQSWRDWTVAGLSRTMAAVTPRDTTAGTIGHAAENAVDRESLGYGTLFIHAGCLGSDGDDSNNDNNNDLLASDVWAFDVRSRKWSELPSAPGPPPQRSPALCISKDLRLFRFGSDSSSKSSDDMAEGTDARLDFLHLEVEMSDTAAGKKTEVAVRVRGRWQTILQHPTSEYTSAFATDTGTSTSTSTSTSPSFAPEMSISHHSQNSAVWPLPRNAAFFEAVTLSGSGGSGRREALVLGFGEQNSTSDGRLLDDVWVYSPLPSPPPSSPLSSSSSAQAGVAAAATLWQSVRRSAGAAREGRGSWRQVVTRPHDDEDTDDAETEWLHDGEGPDMAAQGKVPSTRAWLASAPMTNLEDCAILIWGGLGEEGRRVGDGWILRL